MALAEEMPRRAAEWAAIVDRYGLRAPRSLDEFVGQSFVYADLLLGLRPRPRADAAAREHDQDPPGRLHRVPRQ